MDRVGGAIEHAGLAAAVEQAADGVVITNKNGEVQYVNPAFTAMTGYTRAEVVGQTTRLLKSGHQPAEFYRELWSTIDSGRVWHGELINRRKDGTFYSEDMQISPVRDASHAITGYIAIKHDVTEQRAAQEAQAFLASIVEGSKDAIAATTLEGIIRTWNRGAETVFGYSADEAIGRHVSLLMAPERMDDLSCFIGQLTRGVTVSQYESTCLRRDGSRMPVSVTGSPIRNAAGEVVAMSAVLRDITERRRAEQQLRENEERFRGVFENAPVGMYMAGPDSRIIQVNDAFCRMLGYTEEELLTKCWLELCHSDDTAAALQWRRLLQSGEVETARGESRYIHRNGSVVWAQVKVSFLKAVDGGLTCSIVHVEDITARKQAEEALVESEYRFRIMADSCPTGIWVIDAQGKNLFANRTYLHFCAQTSEQVKQDKWKSLIHPDDAPKFFEELERALRKHTPFHVERRSRNAAGGWRWMESRAVPRFSPTGDFLGLVGTSQDTTERKRAEELLRESEERFRAVFEHAPHGMCVTSMEGRFLQANEAYCRMLGYTEQQLIGRSWPELTHPEDMEPSLRAVEMIQENPGGWGEAEKRYIHRNGAIVWVHLKMAVILDASGAPRCQVVHAEDITERRQAELALKNSEEKFRQLTENIREVFWMMNAAGTEILFVGPAYEEIWGRSCASLYAHAMDWMEAIHPDDRARAHEIFLRQLQGESIDSEYRIRTPKGQEKWIRDRAFPVRDKSGALIRIAGIAEEFTDRKQAERALQASEEKFRQLTENIREVFWVKDAISDQFVYVSPAYERVWGRTCESLYRDSRSWLELVHPDDIDATHKTLAQQSEGKAVESDFRIRTADGPEKWIRNRAFPVLDQSTKLIRIVGVAEEITERKKYEVELIRAREGADAANQAKSCFLANMSHEIRTPMNGVIGMNQLLLETNLTSEQRRYVEVAQTSGRTLLTLIDDILDLSKIEAGKTALENLDFSLQSRSTKYSSLCGFKAAARGS